MNINPAEAPEFRRPVPDEWVDLTDLARSEMLRRDASVPNIEVASAVLAEVKKLDNPDLDNARYHGLGLVMCGMARVLYQPEVRSEAVKTMAQTIYSDWKEGGSYSTRGLLLADISSYSMKYPFVQLARSAGERLAPEDKLVADTLGLAASRRKTALGRTPSDTFTGNLDDDINWILKGSITTSMVGENATAAYAGVLRLVLAKRNELRVLESPAETIFEAYASYQDEQERPSVSGILGESKLEDLNVDSVALACAVLRQDELLDLKKYVDVDEQGRAVFRKEHLVRSRDLAPPKMHIGERSRVVVLHNKRLKCPAVFVKGLIPTVVDIVNESVTEASKLVDDANKFRARGHYF
jgi:hypothetical protein